MSSPHPFLKRGQGTTLKYQINYPALKHSKKPLVQKQPDDPIIDDQKQIDAHSATSQAAKPFKPINPVTAMTQDGFLVYNYDCNTHVEPLQAQEGLLETSFDKPMDNISPNCNPLEGILTPINGPRLIPKRRPLLEEPSSTPAYCSIRTPAPSTSTLIQSFQYNDDERMRFNKPRIPIFERLNDVEVESVSSAKRTIASTMSRISQENDFPNQENQPLEAKREPQIEQPLQYSIVPKTIANLDDFMGKSKNLTVVQKKLAEQLREAIMNFDLAERELREKYQKMFDELQEEKRELAEIKRAQKAEHFENLKIEREKIELTKRVKEQRKNFSVREGTISKQFEDMKHTSMKQYSQLVDVRNKLKRTEAELEKTRKEIESKDKKIELMTNRIEKLKKGHMKAGCCNDLLPTPSNTSADEKQSLNSNIGDQLANKASSSWRQEPSTLATIENLENCPQPLQTESLCGCSITRHDNGDLVWKGAKIQLTHYTNCNATEVRFVDGPVIRLRGNKQFDVLKENGEVISILPDGTRWEKKQNDQEDFKLIKFLPDSDPMRQHESNDRAVRICLDGIGIWYDDGCTRISTKPIAIQLAVSPISQGKIQHLSGEKKILCFSW